MNSLSEKIRKNNIVKLTFIPLAICFVISLLLELSLFNFRYYQTKSCSPLMDVPYMVSNNLTCLDTNVYRIENLDEETYVDVNISDIEIKDVFLDIWPKAESSCADRLKYHFFVADDGDILGYHMPANDYTSAVWQNMYTYVNLSGKVHSFRIYLDEGINEGDLIRFNNIGFNMPVPFSISKKRIVALAILMFLLFILRPESEIYSVKVLDKGKFTAVAIVIAFIVQALIMYKVSNLNGACKNPIFETQHQFELLAEALSGGKVHLLKEPPAELINMSNPYSYQARIQNGTQDEIMYDVAYYDGHYYVYFGIGPILLFYLPYFWITGQHIKTHVVVFIIGCMIAAGWLMLLYEIIKKYFRELPLAVYIECSMLFTAGCGLTYVISRPDFYAVPIMMALACSLFGIAFWLKSIDDSIINPAYICIGSFFMAFVAACRPQFLLGSFLACIVFFTAIFKKRILFSKNSILASILALAPYVIVAAGVMHYNMIRFGSVFDFGANYNLTFNDMTYRGFRIDRLLYSTVGFMFMPAKVTNSFPYFLPGEYITTYQGISTDEQLLGGLFYNNLYLLLIFFIPKLRHYIKDREALFVALIAPVFALIIMIVDGNMAGVLNRYSVDFTWLVCISFFIVFGYLITDNKLMIYRKVVGGLIYFSGLISMVHMFFMIYGGDQNGLENNAIVEFQKMAHLIEFWK